MPYPIDLAGRRARRQRFIDRAIADAQRMGRTITCNESPDHSTCVGAAACLCECHDPRDVP